MGMKMDVSPSKFIYRAVKRNKLPVLYLAPPESPSTSCQETVITASREIEQSTSNRSIKNVWDILVVDKLQNEFVKSQNIMRQRLLIGCGN